MIMRTATIKEIKASIKAKNRRFLIATMTQFFSLFKRIDASSSLLAMTTVTLLAHQIA